MPQMAPTLWVTLLLFTLSVLIIMMMIIYFLPNSLILNNKPVQPPYINTWLW